MATEYSAQVTGGSQSLNSGVITPSNQLSFKPVYGKFTTTASTVPGGGVVQMFTIPAGWILIAGWLKWEDLGATITVDFGVTGSDVDCFADGVDVATAAGTRYVGGVNATEIGHAAQTADDTADILFIDGGGGSVTAGKIIEAYGILMKVVTS